jgi:hypothetical protein
MSVSRWRLLQRCPSYTHLFAHPQSHPTTVQPFLSTRATHQGSIQRSESAGWSLIWGHSQNKGPRTMQLLSKGPPFWEWSPPVGLPIIKNRAKVIINLNTQYIWSVSQSVVVRLTTFRKTWMETKEGDQSPSVKDDCSWLEYMCIRPYLQQICNKSSTDRNSSLKNPLSTWASLLYVAKDAALMEFEWPSSRP